jgi:hypothetical protein
MWDWLAAAHAIHVALVVLTAAGLIHFWARTRFWLPTYVHYLAAVGFALGLACLASMPPNAPIHRNPWGGLTKALLVLAMPALVYVVFIVYGGQKAAYEAARPRDLVVCPYCRDAEVLPDSQCLNCGQTAGS